MKKVIPTGLSLPVELMQQIDKQRGDIPRSRFLLRLIEEAYNEAKKKQVAKLN